jgi:hypothetical protein
MNDGERLHQPPAPSQRGICRMLRGADSQVDHIFHLPDGREAPITAAAQTSDKITSLLRVSEAASKFVT